MNISRIKGIVIVNVLMALCMEALNTQHWTEVSWRNNVYNAKFSLKTRLEHGFAIDCAYFQ